MSPLALLAVAVIGWLAVGTWAAGEAIRDFRRRELWEQHWGAVEDIFDDDPFLTGSDEAWLDSWGIA